MEKKTLVLYPGFGVTHLSPMLELSKLFLRHGGGAALDIVVVVVRSPFDPRFDDTVARAKAANTSVAFHVLPSPPPPPASDSEGDLIVRMFASHRAANAPLRDFLRSLSPARRCALVLDIFCADALDVAAELAVPAYFFSPMAASTLAVFLALPGTRRSLGAAGFGELGDAAVLTFPGVPPVRASDLPQPIRDDGVACKVSLGVFSRMPDARGILFNSFESLEPGAARARAQGRAVRPRTRHASGLLRRAAGLDRRGQGPPRLPPVDGRAAGPQRRVPLLREHGHVPKEPACRDRRLAGELRPEVPLGRAEAAKRPRRARRRRRPRPRRAPPGRVPGADQGQRSGGEELGAAGGRAATPRGRRVRHALRVELDDGGRHGGPAAAVLAAVRGAGAQQGVHRGGDAARGGGGEDRRRGRGRGEGRGGGGEGEVGDGGLRRRAGTQGARGGGEGRAAEALAEEGPAHVAFLRFLDDLLEATKA